MTRQCYCEAKRKTYRRAKRSGLGEYLKKTLDDYRTNAQWQEKLKGITKEFIEHHSQDNVWMMACGQSGSGKTLLCSIVANHLLFNQAREVMYVTWTDFISKLKRDMMGDKTNKVSDYLEEVKKCEVLFLDETLKKYNETDLKYLIEIINYRYTNDLKTIITSERILDELLDIDEATFGRAVEKCEGYLMNIPKDRCKNYRLRAVTV
jgi:DNA replication protein DnaC